MTTTAHDGLPPPRRYFAVLALSFGTALLVTDNAIATVALPTIADALRIDRASAVVIVTVYQLVLLMTILPFSALGDRIGHKRLYQGGQLVFLMATPLCVFADSLPMLLAARTVQSLGVAAALSVGAALLRSIYPQASLGRGLGLNSVIIAGAGALAPTLGGLILEIGSWRWIFAAAAPFGVLSLLMGTILPRSPGRSEPFDLLAAVLCASMFGLVTVGLEAAIRSAPPLFFIPLVAGGVAVGVIFVRRETQSTRPILPVDLLVRPPFALAVFAALAAFVGSMSFALSLPFRLQHNYAMTPGEIGGVMAVWPLTMIAAAPLAGLLSDRAPNGLLGGLGMSLATAGLVLMAFPPPDPAITDFILPMALGGAGFGMFIAPNSRQIVGSAPRDRTASAGALVSTTRLVGQTLGATLLAGLLSLALGNGPAPALIAAACVAIAAACCFGNLYVSRRIDRAASPDGAADPDVIDDAL